MKKYLFAFLLCSASLSFLQGQSLARFPVLFSIDPQVVQDQDDMTWDDYRPIPGKNWADTGLTPERKFRMALVAVDFADQPFVITLPKGSDLFGNPVTDPVRREDVPRFYSDFWLKPSTVNHGQTINGYWMEQSRGKFGITDLDAYGPYRMPRNLWEYGLNEYGQNEFMPDGTKVMRTIADYRQLNDALFHAGTNSGSSFEWIDEHNGLHFYVINRQMSEEGILSYKVGARALKQENRMTGRAPELILPDKVSASGTYILCNITITKDPVAGDDATIDDIYRLSVVSETEGWKAELLNTLAAPAPGERTSVGLLLENAAGTHKDPVIKVEAVSESSGAVINSVMKKIRITN